MKRKREKENGLPLRKRRKVTKLQHRSDGSIGNNGEPIPRIPLLGVNGSIQNERILPMNNNNNNSENVPENENPELIRQVNESNEVFWPLKLPNGKPIPNNAQKIESPKMKTRKRPDIFILPKDYPYDYDLPQTINESAIFLFCDDSKSFNGRISSKPNFRKASTIGVETFDDALQFFCLFLNEEVVQHLWKETNHYFKFNEIFKENIKNTQSWWRKKKKQSKSDRIISFSDISKEEIDTVEENEEDEEDSIEEIQSISNNIPNEYKVPDFKDWKKIPENEVKEENFEFPKLKILNYLFALILHGSEHGNNDISSNWSFEDRKKYIPSLISFKEFKKLQKYFHFDVDFLIENFNKCSTKYYVPTGYLSIDESICAFKGISNMKVYIKSKPHKHGLKIFALADSKGYAIKLLLYKGSKSEFDTSGGGVVKELIDEQLSEEERTKWFGTSEEVNGVLAIDNYFGSKNLALHLKEMNIPSVMTIRKTSLGSSEIHDYFNKVVKQKGDCICAFDVTNRNILFCMMFSSKKVFFITNEIHNKLIRRKKGTAKEYIDHLIRYVYNISMGGVDSFDGSLYRMIPKTKCLKWSKKFFLYYLQSCLVDSWILCQTCRENRGIEKRYGQYQFICEVTDSYVKRVNLQPTITRQHLPQLLPLEEAEKKSLNQGKCKTIYCHFCRDIRYSSAKGAPIDEKKRIRTKQVVACSHFNCRGKFFCSNKNCFLECHKKQFF